MSFPISFPTFCRKIRLNESSSDPEQEQWDNCLIIIKIQAVEILQPLEAVDQGAFVDMQRLGRGRKMEAQTAPVVDQLHAVLAFVHVEEPFGERCLDRTTDIFGDTCRHPFEPEISCRQALFFSYACTDNAECESGVFIGLAQQCETAGRSADADLQLSLTFPAAGFLQLSAFCSK